VTEVKNEVVGHNLHLKQLVGVLTGDSNAAYDNTPLSEEQD